MNGDLGTLNRDVPEEINNVPVKAVPVSADKIILEDSADSWKKKSATLSSLPGGGGGEANTASNAGSGSSLFYQKVGLDLEFNGIKSENSYIQIAIDAVSHDIEVTAVVGAVANTLCAGDDARLSDARTPTAHASSHQSGGGDPIKLDDLASPDDNTDLDSTTGKHGLLPKLGGGTTDFLRADGTWAAPPGAGGGESNTMSSQGSGSSIYYQKSGVDLQLNGIKSENAYIDVSLDAVSHDIEITANVGAVGNTLCAGDDARLSDDRDPTAHASEHTDGTDDIQNATAGQKGLATAAQITKLDGIEALADVTDAVNVEAAGALMADGGNPLTGDWAIGEQGIQLDPALGTDHHYSGITAQMQVDVNGTGFGAALYMASDGNLEEADADADTTMPCFCLALEAGTGSKKVLLQGFIRDDTWNWTNVGATLGIVYVSTTTGALTQTPPSGSGDQVQRVGFAISADAIYFNPSLDVIEIS